MKYLPIFVDLRGRTCLLVGGGGVAARKAELLHSAGARLRLVAPLICDSLRQLASATELELIEREYEAHDLRHVQLVVAATDDRAQNARVAADANARGLWVNVVDSPELCSFIMPAIVDRSPVIAAISTGGASPVLARLVRSRVETALPEALGRLAEFAAKRRELVRGRILDPAKRRAFWERFFASESAERMLEAGDAEADSAFEEALVAALELDEGSQLALIAGCDAERLSWAAVRWLASADLVAHAGELSSALRSVVRRDAERVPLEVSESDPDALSRSLTHLLLAHARRSLRIAVVLYREDADFAPTITALRAQGLDARVFKPAPK